MTLTVRELIEVLKDFDEDLPILIGADGVTWDINSKSSIFTQDIEGKPNVVIWEGYYH